MHRETIPAMTITKPLQFTQAALMNGEILLVEFSDKTQAVLSLEQILAVAERKPSLLQMGG